MKLYTLARRFLSEEIRPYLTYPRKKPPGRQLRELLALARTYRFLPYHYFKEQLYAGDAPANLLDYIPPKLIERVQEGENPGDALGIVRDKARFGAFMQAAGLRCIATVATVDREGTIRDGEGAELDRAGFAHRAALHGNRLFAKPQAGAQGSGTRILEVGPETFDGLSALRGCILQPVVVNHPDLARLFPGALNTIRLDTWREGDAWVHNGAALRMGIGDMVVDNWAAGGLVIGADIETGRLYRRAVRKTRYCDHGGFDRHPDTGVTFEDYPLPFWPEVRALTVAAAEAALPLRTLCWDVAITPEGPILVEANDHWSVNMLQTAWGGMGNTPIGRAARRRHGLPADPPASRVVEQIAPSQVRQY
jgi:hypothetical protein